MIYLLIYLSGVVMSYGLTTHFYNNWETSMTLSNPEPSFHKWTSLWYKEDGFDKQWNSAVGYRRFTLIANIVMSLIGSWLTFMIYLPDRDVKPGLSWRLTPLPDKERFRKHVENAKQIYSLK